MPILGKLARIGDIPAPDDVPQSGGILYTSGIQNETEVILKNTDMDANDIAYLLGYQELNSFLRAFASWTGVTVGQFRKQ